jgi:outer membrane beta-barrel protein
MGTQKATCIRILAGGLVALAFLTTPPSFAQAKRQAGSPAKIEAAKPSAGASDKVDITDLENKYWAPKDTDFSVVQNRTFSKDNKFSVAPLIGRPINDAHSEGMIYGVAGNYFWYERMGVQATYIKGDLDNNDATNDLATYGSGVQPDHGKFSQYFGVGYNLVPFYAKMSFWGKKIIYFDMAFTAHLGLTEYDQIMEGGNDSKTAFTYGLDISQFYFFSRWLAIRVDLKNQFYTQEVLKYRNSTGYQKGDKVGTKDIHDTMFYIGAMFYFGKGR